MTLVRICPALRPRSGRCARPLRHLGTAPATVTTKAPTITSLSRLNHTASTVAAYASRLGRPARARLASGCWPALPGGIGYPQGHYRRFPPVTSSLPPSPGLSWRDTKHISRVARGALENYRYPPAVRFKEGGHLGRCLSYLGGSARGRPRVVVPCTHLKRNGARVRRHSTGGTPGLCATVPEAVDAAEDDPPRGRAPEGVARDGPVGRRTSRTPPLLIPLVRRTAWSRRAPFS
jgi:hypothetical protein